MLGWLTLGGIVLVLGILADDWLANRHRRPLSQMRPTPRDAKKLGMEATDTTNLNKTLDRVRK